ncbi:putative polysaccharide biosynthesis protein [Paenibacillus mucilaginosus]|uniref:Polysaccharide biosynthesis protein n=1 Tax=Paenibacillus mucilaginosus (strain KNP414) TaxID=1036673 RepID=F8FHF2_PAEMK|nr:polysaccharide biosynthesis protein [Paenibacillus mucilaginosus]AEI42260.1 polysaccharide biosynthesis protein [Paenibacillus mucilaginosus KNP414]MCG7214221.1 polysaccharide biosynthesis protein [Paenibacillus mucilaginosus]WDM28733.1 polysaccharide biosynthesis protein [Paenibacillus mucilaginosus]
MSSKDSLVKGTLILSLAALVARALGVIQRIPLVALLTMAGMAPYGVAFNLYSVLLVVATAGIPSALSKMISERTALGRYAEADRIYKASLQFAVGAGIVMALILWFVAPSFAASSEQPKAVLAIRAIAPALLLFPVIAIMRGYFQGRRMMAPNGISQVIEQIFRVVTSVALAYLLLERGLVYAVAGASFGGVIGGVAALAVMLYYGSKLRRQDQQERGTIPPEQKAAAAALGAGTIYKQLFRLSVPIVIFSVTVTLVYLIDSWLATPLLKGAMGVEDAGRVLGILTGQAQSLAGIPIILAVALSQSVVPIISSAYAQNDLKQVAEQTGKVLQLSILTGLPAVLVIALAARPLNFFIFENEAGTLIDDRFAPGVIAALTVTAIFQIVMQTSGAVLMGMGRMKPLMAGVGVGIAVKLAASFALVPFFGIYGLVAATALCFIVMAAINLSVLRGAVAYRVFGLRRWAGLVFSTAAVTGIGIVLDVLCRDAVNPLGHLRADSFLQAVIICAVTGAAYILLLFLTRVMTLQDLDRMPGPLRKLAKPLQRRLGRPGQTG